MKPVAIIQAVSDLRQLYEEFTPETEVWERTCHLRSPYRALLLMGLSIGESDKQCFPVWRELLDICPTAAGLKKQWTNNPGKIASIISQLGLKQQRIDIINTAVAFGNQIPSDPEKLQSKPGIGSVIARNVVAYGFGKPALPIDSNVKRVAERIAGSPFKDYQAVREYLEELFTPNDWIDVHELLRLHGQVLCGIVPKCKDCPITICSKRKLSYTGSAKMAQQRAKPVIEEWENWRNLLLNPPQ